MTIPLYLQWFSKRIGKPVAAFTKEDWRNAATSAAEVICPEPRARGRPKKQKNFLRELLYPPRQKGPRGRPEQLYYGLPASAISNIVDSLSTREVTNRWPDAPTKKRQILQNVLSILQKKHGGFHALQAVERALRREKADKNKKKLRSIYA